MARQMTRFTQVTGLDARTWRVSRSLRTLARGGVFGLGCVGTGLMVAALLLPSAARSCDNNHGPRPCTAEPAPGPDGCPKCSDPGPDCPEAEGWVPPPPAPSSGGTTPCTTCGAPRLSADARSQQVTVDDIPLWYAPPLGPKVEMQLCYDRNDGRVLDTAPDEPTEVLSYPTGRRCLLLYHSYVHALEGGFNVFMPRFANMRFVLDHDNVYQMQEWTNDSMRLVVAADGRLWFRTKADAVFVFEPDPLITNRYRLALHYANPLQPPTALNWDTLTGRLLSVTSADGLVFPFTYDTSGHVTAISDPFGRSMVLQYSGDFLTGVADMAGQAFVYTYDTPSAELTSITRNDNRTTTISYLDDSTQHRITVTDPDGHVTQHVFLIPATGPARMCTYGPDGQITRDEFVGSNDLVRWRAGADGLRTYFTHEPNLPSDEYLHTATDPNGLTTSRYGHNDMVLYRTTKSAVVNGVTTLYRDETWDNTFFTDTEPLAPSLSVHKVLDPTTSAVLEQTTTTYTRFENGTPSTPEDDLIAKTAETRLISDNGTPNDPGDDVLAETRWSYGTDGRLLAVLERVAAGELPESFVTTASYTYDTAGRCVAEADAVGHVTTYTYNTRGLLSSKTEPGDRVTLYSHDNLNRQTQATYPDTSTESWTYGCCGLESHTDRTGTVTTYVRQDGKPLLETTETPAEHTLAQTSYEYDTCGRLIRTTDALGFQATTTYNAIGQRTATTDARGSITRYTYDEQGRLVAQADAQGRATWYAYDALSRIVGTGATLDGQEVTLNASTFDGAGRLATSTDAVGQVTAYEYDGLGRVVKDTRPDGTIVTTTYDRRGNRLTEAAPHLATDPSPPVTAYTYDDTGRLVTVTDPAGQIVTAEYHADFADAVTAVKHQASANDPQVTVYSATYDTNGRKASETRDGVTVEHTYSTDGRPLRTTYADASYTESTYDGPLLLSARDRAANVTAFTYDSLGRRTAATNARNMSTTTTYVANSELPASVTDPLGNTTTFQYDTAGRRTHTVFPGTGAAAARTQVTTYDDLGRAVRVDGAKTYPLTYEYDLAGRMTALIDGNGSRTQWAYNAMGRLTTKTYADGSDYEYGYDAEGRLVSRTDGKGVTTEYEYDTLGRLVTTDYPTDPDVTTVYDALGRRTSVTDATGTWTYTYDGVSSRAATVTDPDGNVLSYTYDACGERASMSLTVDGTAVTDLDYTFTDGRLTEIESAGSAGVPTGIFSYGYLANSNLVQTLTHALDVENPVPMTTTRTWDNADRLLNIESVGGAVPAAVSSFSYTLDAQGRRTRRDDLDGTHIDWSYNNRDELTAAVRSGYPASSPFGSCPYTYSYTFDDIGNHLRQEKNGTAFAARYNSLNELLEREVTGPVRVQGTADGVLPIGVKVDGTAAETATVDADTAAWRGDSRLIQPGQTGSKSVSVVATDSAQPPKETESVRTVELPPTNPVRFTHDLNGNMTSDGTWTYTWDTENRLAAMESTAAVPAAARLRLAFTYDSQWRRRTKSVYAWDDQNQAWTLTRSHVFLYDHWNLIHEIATDHTQTPTVASATSYVWGLDLSQSLHRAGGVGGLLSIARPSTLVPLFACYDGNGNVVALASATDGSLAAQYDYSPFGETVAATGSAAEANPFRFSTKYHDPNTGLVYYGYRYCNPAQGRWVSRDPVGEAGSPGPFCFVLNTATALCDALGLIAFSFQGTWDPGHQSTVQSLLTDLRGRVPDLQVGLSRLGSILSSVPGSCPVKALLQFGLTDLRSSIGLLTAKLSGPDTVKLYATDSAAESYAWVPTPFGVPLNRVHFNTHEGGFFDPAPADGDPAATRDFQMGTLFEELLHLPGVGLSHPGMTGDPFNDPTAFRGIIRRPKDFGLGGVIEEAIERKANGGMPMTPDMRRALAACCGGQATWDLLFKNGGGAGP